MKVPIARRTNWQVPTVALGIRSACSPTKNGRSAVSHDVYPMNSDSRRHQHA